MPMDFSEASQLLWLHLQPLNADIAFVAPIPGLLAEMFVLGMVLAAFAQDPSAVDGFLVDSCCAPFSLCCSCAGLLPDCVSSYSLTSSK